MEGKDEPTVSTLIALSMSLGKVHASSEVQSALVIQESSEVQSALVIQEQAIVYEKRTNGN
jgi:hypothetical protein